MLFNLSYKDSQNTLHLVNLSGSSMSAAILYCDSNNFIPQAISNFDTEVILNEPSSQVCYSVILLNQSNLQQSYLIYDTLSNVNSWIANQTDKTLNSLSKQNRAFIQA
jgi:hypothetical protein